MGSQVSLRFWDGTEIGAWETYELRDSFVDPLGLFNLTARPPRSKIPFYDRYLYRGELVAIQVDGIPQATPIITTTQRDIGMDGVKFSIECKSVLVTPYEGSVDPNISKKLNADTPAYIAVLEALAPYNFEEIEGTDAVNIGALSGKPLGKELPPIELEELKHNQFEANNGETAYGFCSRILNRLGVVLRVDWQGGLIVSVPQYNQPVSYTLVQSTKENSVVGDRMYNIRMHESNDGQFSDVIVRGSQREKSGRTVAARPKAKVSERQQARVKQMLIRRGRTPDQAQDILDKAEDRQIEVTVAAEAPSVDFQPSLPSYYAPAAAYKPLYYTDRKSRDKKWCLNLAKLLYGMRTKSANVITCEVSGHKSITGKIWTVNTIARVVIEVLGVDEEMWILERTFIGDVSGQKTRLKLIPKGALVLGEVPYG